MDLKLNSAKATVLLILVAAGLSLVSVAINQIDMTTLPAGVPEIVQVIQYIFASSAIAPLFVIIRNAYGYWSKVPGNRESIQYEAAQLWQTWIRYEEYIKGAAVLIVVLTKGTKFEPYAYLISGSVAFFIDLIRKSLSEIATKPAT